MDRETLDTILTEHQTWLEQKGGRQADLTMADLRGVDLHGVNLSHAELQGAVLDDANLNDTKLRWASLSGASLERASLQRADLEAAEARGANFTGADFQQASMTAVDAQNAVFEGASLEHAALRAGRFAGAYFQKSSLAHATLVGSDLTDTDLQRVDCTGAVFLEAKLNGADLAGAKLDQADMRGTDLRGVRLTEATQEGTDLRGAALEADASPVSRRDMLDTILTEHQTWLETGGQNGRVANLEMADLAGMDLGGVNLTGAKFHGARLEGTNLREANLAEADMSFTRAEKADFSAASLEAANLDHADLGRTTLQVSSLRRANFTEANLYRADLQRVDATQANFTEANLNSADLTHAQLRGSNFHGADLTEAKLNGANLEDANLQRAWLISTELEGANLRRTILEREDSPTQQPTVWETVKEAVADWITRARAGKDPDYEHYPHWDTRKADEEARIPNLPEPQEREERRLDVSSPGPTEAAGGSFAVLHSKADAEQYAQRLPQSQESRIDRIIDADGPTDSYAVTSLPAPAEVARDERVADPADRAKAAPLMETVQQRGGAGFSRAEAGEERRLDVSSPGPTEAPGISFRAFHSKADAEQYAQHLPQSQETYIDRIITASHPTGAYAVTSLPAPAEVARDERVAQRVGRIQDPDRRAEAERLLRIIREEGAARDRSTHRAQEATLER